MNSQTKGQTLIDFSLVAKVKKKRIWGITISYALKNYNLHRRELFNNFKGIYFLFSYINLKSEENFSIFTK